MRMIITLLLLATTGLPLRAEMTVKEYREAITSRNQSIVNLVKTYLEGLGEGMSWINTLELRKRSSPAYCEPDKLALTIQNYMQILDMEIAASAAAMSKTQLDSTPIPILLLEGLKETFPCSNRK